METRPNHAQETIVDDAYMPPSLSPWRETWRLLRQNSMALIGLVIFMFFFGIALTGMLLTSGDAPILDPAQIRLQEKLRPPLARPNLETLQPAEVPELGIYLLGTDDLGRDVFARMLQGAWVSLTVGFVAVAIAVAIGIFLGGLSGYYGQEYIQVIQIVMVLIAGVALWLAATHAWPGAVFLAIGGAAGWLLYRRYAGGSKKSATPDALRWLSRPIMSVDTLIMRLVDIMLCFPSFFLILTVVALLPPSLYNIMVVIGLTSWMGTTRFVRAEFLSLREQDFVAAARALGISDMRIIFRHIMPNAVAPVLVSATLGIASAMLTEAGLSFLGFGVPPPHATWGNILSDGKDFIFDAPWLTFAPGIVILVVVLAFNLFGEGLRDILNPKLRKRT
ncbi:MAG: peptide ABC transporter permease [Desulfatitalea sp. BRH_c12]|nr:MAG: peptide ABC transporter permease [Desulfatitalea sp. BRH_c12]